MDLHPELRSTTQGCFDRTSSALTVDDVYEIAKLIGSEVEKLIDGYGNESVEALVPKIVKVLELLESFASRNQAQKLREEELLKTFETLQLQQQKKRGAKDSEEVNDKNEIRVRRGRFQPCHHFVNNIVRSYAFSVVLWAPQYNFKDVLSVIYDAVCILGTFCLE